MKLIEWVFLAASFGAVLSLSAGFGALVSGRYALAVLNGLGALLWLLAGMWGVARG